MANQFDLQSNFYGRHREINYIWFMNFLIINFEHFVYGFVVPILAGLVGTHFVCKRRALGVLRSG